MTEPGFNTASLDAFLRPAAVAFFDASENNPGSLGSLALRNLRACGYPGAAVVVHPTADRVFGFPAVATLADAGIGPARRVIVSYLERARQAGFFNAEALVELLGMVGGIAAALGSDLGSLDLNPMIVTGDGLTGVDALAVLTAEIP